MQKVISKSVSRENVERAAEIAAGASSKKGRDRIYVSQAINFALRDFFESGLQVETRDGRSSNAKFTELLDVNDFFAADWSIEVRVLTNVEEPALYVPTVPLLVGFLSDLYVCVKTQLDLKEFDVLGYATREQLSNADLSPNGLMAVLPLDDLTPWHSLRDRLLQLKALSEHETDVFNEWQTRADKLSRNLEHILANEEVFDFGQIEKIVDSLHDEILRVYSNRANPIGIEHLYNKLTDRFNLPEPIRAHPESPLVFKNSKRDDARAASNKTENSYFKDKLGVGGRMGLYRRLLEADEAFESHRRLKAALDHASGGKLHASKRRRTQVDQLKEKRAEAEQKIPIPPPITGPQEKAEIDEWFAEFDQKSPIIVTNNKRLHEERMLDKLKPNTIVTGPLLSEPLRIIITQPIGDSIKIIGKGMTTGQVHEPVLNPQQLALLQFTDDQPTFDGDPLKFRLGIEALRLGLAYEYDPFFALSVARVDPLPHQLEAVYDYFLKLPRIRFLLADDPGAGKTIMAGLLLKELKLRGLIKRILIITPASLSFQWQREMKDKFREDFEIVRGDVLRANYGSNPFQDKDQVVTSISWVSVIDEAKSSLLRSDWDLIIVDEAHKLSAHSSDKKTYAYQLGEKLFEQTDHLLLMTATPHKGDQKHFCLFLELLDRDVYGDVKSLKDAVARRDAPFYLRRTKEALITFPDPETGKSEKIFTKRIVKTTPFEIDNEEAELYDDLTKYVEDQSIKAAQDDSARGRALGFTMAMLQRRFASSIYALRRSLQRMQEKRKKILDDPEGYRREQIERRQPEDFDDLPEAEQQKIIEALEGVVADVNPVALREEIQELGHLIERSVELEKREIESKLARLKKEIFDPGIFDDPKNKLLIFTEHKDTLDFLVEKLRGWGLSVTQIHGGMHVGDRDTPGSRIYAEREFKESAQVMVATEAAGEGINLQFCWFMINYDMPWNPVRLEQRMGRIHRYGQPKDCLILNFVSTNTREGRVLEKLLARLEQISAELDKEHVFDVVGEMLPGNSLEKMFREMYAHHLTEEALNARIVEEVDIEKIRHISESTLEGLAKNSLNISALTQKRADANERRLVPEIIEDFFMNAAPVSGVQPRRMSNAEKTFRVGRVPRTLWPIGDQLEKRFGKLGREYKQIVFDKKSAENNSLSEWVTPGHPLFESVRVDVERQVNGDLQRGSVFYDFNAASPYRLETVTAAIKDGLGNTLHRRVFLIKTDLSRNQELREPTMLFDLAAPPTATNLPDQVVNAALPTKPDSESFLITNALVSLLDGVQEERERESSNVLRHIEMSLNELISRQQVRHLDLIDQQERDDTSQPVAANLKLVTDKLDDLNNRLEKRRREIEQERHCSIGDIQFIGSCWVLPHPDRELPELASILRDEAIERQATALVVAQEEAQGRVVEMVQQQNRGFDLVSRLPHLDDAMSAMDIRFIKVKGIAGIGQIALTTNEYKTSVRLKRDYWLYVVFDCSTDSPRINIVNDPARLKWQSLNVIEHYHIGPEAITEAAKQQ